MDDVFDSSFLLILSTARHIYAVRRDHILELRVIAGPGDCERPDRRGKPVRGVSLGPLLDPTEQEIEGRCHAVIVAPNRRRSVALLVARVEHFATGTEESVHPLPELLQRRLARPWFLGVLLDYDQEPVLVLDVRQIAKDLLIEKTRSQTYATDHEQPNHVLPE